MVQSLFAQGWLTTIPAGANPTPVRFGACQDISVDWGWDTKPLHGNNQFPLEHGRGKGKIQIKVAVGRIDPNLFNQVVFGATLATGEKLNSIEETSAIPTTPFQITVVNGANFSVDLGVFDATALIFLTRVASAPATGQYSVTIATGVFLFAAADVGHIVRISYTYTSAGTGKTITGGNPLLGAPPIFGAHLVNAFRGKSQWMNFPAAVSEKLSFPMKLDDFTLPAIDMLVQDDGTGNVYYMSETG